MTFRLQHDAFSFGADFTVADDRDETAFVVRGHAFSFMRPIELCDASGQVLAEIRRRSLLASAGHDIGMADGRSFHIAPRPFSLTRPVFEVSTGDRVVLECEGDFFGHEYTFRRDGEVVATVSRRWFTLLNTYGVDVVPAEDPALILCCAVVIDSVRHSDST